MGAMTDEALIEELALSLDMFLTHHVERDTLACDLTNEELTLMATGMADIIKRREIEAGEKVKQAAAALCQSRFMGDLNREDIEARKCAEAIRDMNVAEIVGGGNNA